MIDTYKDTTGSRKKFLIPLVVLLLCAVSLTGAGYAYNSSVTLNGNTGDVDETFVVDLYDTSDNLIKASINLNEGVNGIVFVTDKAVAATSVLKGHFELEDMNVVLYTGKLKVTGDALARGTAADDDIAHAQTTEANLTAINTSGKIYKASADDIALTVTVKFYDSADCTNEVTKATINGSDVYFRVIVTAVASTEITDSSGDLNAKTFAAAVVGDGGYAVEFSFGVQAAAIEGNVPTVPTYEVDGHAYQLDATTPYEWDDSDMADLSCTVNFTCANNSAHKETVVVVKADMDYDVTVEATCNSTGIGVYTVSGDWNGIHYEDTYEVEIPVVESP